MKIGILTFHFSINYGAVVQAWALQQYLRMNGFDAQIIDYDPRPRRYPWWIHAFKCGWRRFVKELKFRGFIKKHLKVTKPISNADLENGLSFDTYIVGSDQVWNIDFFSFNRRYFLDFAGLKKRIAYGASIGEGKWTPFQKELVRLLKPFDYISVRENFAKKTISPLISQDVCVVPDPTILIDRVEYERFLFAPQKQKNKRYRIFVYGLNALDRCIKIVKTILIFHPYAEVRVVRFSDVPISGLTCPVKELCLDPIGWLNEIVQSDIVVTDSFHGVAVSAKLRKAFYTFYKKEEPNTSDRIRTLLHELGMEDRALDLTNIVIKEDKPDEIFQDNYFEKMDRYMKLGQLFLKNALQKST